MTLEQYLKADRQWPHHLRVGHAKYQLANATTPREKEFWRAVLDANDKRAS